MEATTLFLLLLLPPADTAGDTASAIQASLRHQLGEVSMVIAPDTLVTPSMWQGEKAQMRARFVVHVASEAANSVKIDLLAGADSPSKPYRGARELAFAPEDSRAERGRAIGLVIAELLRSSPTWAWADGRVGVAAAAPSRLELDGMFVADRPTSGVWAYGPALAYGFGLSEAFQLRAAAMALFGGSDQYKEMGITVGANWDFLRLAEDRYALGVEAFGGYLYENAVFAYGSGDHSGTWTLIQSNGVFGMGLRGRAKIWRSLRFVADADLRLLTGELQSRTDYVGDDNKIMPVKSPLHYSRWRPTLWVGLELAI